MTPAYSRAFFPVAELVFRQLESTKSKFAIPQIVESHHVQRIQQLIRTEIDKLSWELKGAEEWEEYAKYALVVWIDRTMQSDPIIGRSWRESPLEIHYFRSTLADDQFFQRCESARQLRYNDAIEIFFLCFVLGFCQIYADPSRVKRLGLPATSKEWRRSLAQTVVDNRPPAKTSSNPVRDYVRVRSNGWRQFQFAVVALAFGTTFFLSALFGFWEMIVGK
jgi:type IV/VI secretion system ImpK/VasF family protein